jgi:CubicO group peptidase (beta-lactamase class C family)
MKCHYRALIFLLLLSSYESFAESKSLQFQKASGDLVSSDELGEVINKTITSENIPGLAIAVINEGKVVYSLATGVESTDGKTPLKTTSIFEVASLSKPVFAHFVMRLVQEGVLELDTALYDYLPHPDVSADDRYRKITARMVLSHSTGMPNWWRDEPKTSDRKLKYEPGTGFSYSGEGYQYLVQVLKKIFKVDDIGLEQEFNKRVAAKLGLKDFQFIPDQKLIARKVSPHKGMEEIAKVAPYSNFGAAYGVHASIESYAKWATAVLNNELLDPRNQSQLFKPHNFRVPSDYYGRQLGLDSWALGFSIYHFPQKMACHGGNNPGYTIIVCIQRDSKWGVVILSNADQVTLAQSQILGYLVK